MPEHLIDVAGWWAEFNPAPANPSTGRKPNLNEEHPTPCVVPYTDDGYEIMARLGEMADREYKVAMKRRDYVRATIWTRAFETAGRLALVYACSKDYRTPRIDPEAAAWATQFAEHLTRRMLFMAKSYVADNPFHADCLKLKRILRMHPDHTASHSRVLKRMKMDARSFRMLVETLVEQGDVKVLPEGRVAGSRGCRYVLQRG